MATVTGDEKRRARRAWTAKQARLRRQAMVDEKKGNKCFDCGGTFDPVVMDLEHWDPSTKVASISYLVRWGTLTQLKEELKKVIPLCCICHRLRTHYGGPRGC